AVDGGADADPQAIRAEADAALRAYLPQLAAAYKEGDATLLTDYAAPKEIASVAALVEQLADRGQFYDNRLEQLTVEKTSADRTTIYATVVELWDVDVRAVGSEELVNSYEDLRYRVQYQLKRGDGELAERWLVYFRAVLEEP
ncbi:MAG: hypothetical protein AAGD38_18005, partial [Acidobacteriota bacterium]